MDEQEQQSETGEDGALMPVLLILAGVSAIVFAVAGSFVTINAEIWEDLDGATQFTIMQPFVLTALLGTWGLAHGTRMD